MVGQVWELKLTPAQREVLMAYADHADHNGDNIRPGIGFIAWKTDYSERQVQRITAELVADGLLVVTALSARGRPTCYRMDLSKGERKAPYVARKRGDRMSPQPETGDNLSGQVGDKMSPQLMNGVTSHGKDESEWGDMASADLSRILLKEEPKEEKSLDTFFSLPADPQASRTRGLGTPTQQAAWDAAYQQLEFQLDRGGFETYVRGSWLLRVEDDQVYVIGVRSESAQKTLESQFYRMVRRVLMDVIGASTGQGAMELRFEVVDQEPEPDWIPPDMRGEELKQPY